MKPGHTKKWAPPAFLHCHVFWSAFWSLAIQHNKTAYRTKSTETKHMNLPITGDNYHWEQCSEVATKLQSSDGRDHISEVQIIDNMHTYHQHFPPHLSSNGQEVLDTGTKWLKAGLKRI